MTNLLEQYREKDEKTSQGEVLPQNETLNGERIGEYLQKNNFTDVDNFNKRLSMEHIYGVLSLGNTKGEQEIFSSIQSAHNYLITIDKPNLFIESPSRESFISTVKKELLKRNQLDKEAHLIKAYDEFFLVKDIMRKRLLIHQSFIDQRQENKTDFGGDLKKTFRDAFNTVKKNFNKMDSKEKLISVGALVIGGIWFSKSSNEKVADIRSALWSGFKLVGGAGAIAFGANSLWKLFTGKSAVTAFSDAVSSSTGSSDFWEKTFDTDDKKAETLRKGIVHFGDKDFMTISKKYREAKALGHKKIELPSVKKKDISPEEVFVALDLFFSKYPVEQLELRYRKSPSKPSFLDVATTVMTEDGKINFSENFYNSTLNKVNDLTTRGWNWLVTGAGLEFGKKLYLKFFGVEGTDQEVRNWVQQDLTSNSDKTVDNENSLPNYIDRHFPNDPAFKTCILSGSTDLNHPNIKFHETSEAIYIISTSNIDYVNNTGEQVIASALDGAVFSTDDFIKYKYSHLSPDILKNKSVSGAVRVIDNAKLNMFVKIPLKK